MKKNAFTLVEIMIVIAIIAILAAVAIPSLAQNRETAWRRTAADNARTVKSAVVAYMSQNPNALMADLDTFNAAAAGVAQTPGNFMDEDQDTLAELTIGSQVPTFVDGVLLYDGKDPLTEDMSTVEFGQ